jgi:hypothetical protein
MLKTGLVLALSTALLGTMGSKASAQIVAGVYVPAPAYVEVGPPPGYGYIWVPAHRRWEYRPQFDYRFDYRRDRDAFRDHDRQFDRDRYAHRDRDDRRDWR